MHFTFAGLVPIIVRANLNSGMAFGLLSGTGIVGAVTPAFGLLLATAPIAQQFTPQRVPQVLPRSQRGT
jgi:hypothetical protein